MTMLYEDGDYDLSDHMGGMMLGGVGTTVSAKHNPYIEFQRQNTKTFKPTKTKTASERRSEAYKKWLKSKAYRDWILSLEGKAKKEKKTKAPKEPKPRKARTVPARTALNARRYDVHDVRKRLFSKSAKHPLSAYTAEEQDKLNADLVALGSGAHMGRRHGRKQVHQCPHCGGAWYDSVLDTIKTVAPYVAPLLL